MIRVVGRSISAKDFGSDDARSTVGRHPPRLTDVKKSKKDWT
jgi:hypothetical protein